MSDRPAPRRLTRHIPSQLADVDRLCLDARGFFRSHGTLVPQFGAELALREGLNNAVLHGSAGNPRKRVGIDLRVGRTWLRMEISDQGRGFPWRERLGRELPDPSRSGGRGLPLLRTYADRVRFNRRGNTVTLWLRLARKETPPHGCIHD
jgi:serine/threonine-protein kinase RsbW